MDEVRRSHESRGEVIRLKIQLIAGVVTKWQALDKLLAMMTDLAKSAPDVNLSLLVPERILESLSDAPVTSSILHSLPHRVVSIDPARCDPKGILKQFVRETQDRPILLVPYSKDSDNLSVRFSEAGAEVGCRVVAFFKSLHDEGYGFTTQPNADHSLSLAGKNLRRIGNLTRNAARSSKPRRNRLRRSNFSLYLAFDAEHASILASKGIPKAKISVAGYPLQSTTWIQTVRVAAGPYRQEEAKIRIALFPRGETPGRPPTENVVPHDDLRRYLMWLANGLDTIPAVRRRGFYLTVKPHPIQSRGVLNELLTQFFGSGFRLTEELPAIVASSCDVAVSTYSSTLLDALLFGVPSIEILEENDWFRRKHPMGSPFLSLGVARASSPEELTTHLESAFEYGKQMSSGSLGFPSRIAEALELGCRDTR